MATEFLPKYQVDTSNIKFPIAKPKRDENKKVKALVWHSTRNVSVEMLGKPMITEPADAIVRVTSAAICGSDLHLYNNEFSGMHDGFVLGHESMGVVESVGTQVTMFKPGDRVVIAAVIAEGTCEWCKKGQYSLCDCTNPSKTMEGLYGHRTAGIFGYSDLTGGYDGTQSEYVRVPLADMSLLKVPSNLPDEKLVGLSDTFVTGYHACELGNVQMGQTVAIWGMGPIGLMAAAWAKFKGASRVIGIDCYQHRLNLAEKKLGIETVDFGKVDPVKWIQENVKGGPDVCIDAAGFRFPKSLLHKFQRAVRLETDDPTILKECITACKKGGTISVVGDYYAYANQFPIGAFMEKGLTMRAGQVFLHKYWKEILAYIESGQFDPSFVWSHVMPFDKAAEAYRMFDERSDDCVKILLKTGMPA